MEACALKGTEKQGTRTGEGEVMGMDKGEGANGDVNMVDRSKFGPWIHVQRKPRRQGVQGRGVKDGKIDKNTDYKKGESRFSILEEGLEILEDDRRFIYKGEERIQQDSTGVAFGKGALGDGGGKAGPSRRPVGKHEKYTKSRGEEGTILSEAGLDSRKVASKAVVEEPRSRREGKEHEKQAARDEVEDLGSKGGMWEDIGREGGEASQETGLSLSLPSHFDWGYPRKPPFTGRKIYRKARSMQDSGGKRSSAPLVEELTKKPARPRVEEVETSMSLEEVEVVSMVESTFKEGPTEME